MNPITVLTEGVNNLWYWTYGIIAGWGLTFTIMVAVIVVVLIRTVNLQRRIDRLEQRLVHAERDYNLSLDKWQKK